MPNFYIIAGCNGAGKTTASYTILPEMLNCKEFVNADSIAAGLSPFNYESVAFEAVRIMLQRIYQLMKKLILHLRLLWRQKIMCSLLKSQRYLITKLRYSTSG